MTLELLIDKKQTFKKALASKSISEIKEYQLALYKELNRLYVVMGLGKLKKTSILSQIRRQIALTHTLLGQKNENT